MKNTFVLFVCLGFLFSCATQNAPIKKDVAQINTGYGMIDANKNTTAISTTEVDPKELATVTWMELLQRTAGMTVTGQGNNLSVRIRAKKSINGDQEPLFVVNNTPVGNGFSSIAFLDPALVKRISVLKDAASSSAYGSRGGNGVILVTLR